MLNEDIYPCVFPSNTLSYPSLLARKSSKAGPAASVSLNNAFALDDPFTVARYRTCPGTVGRIARMQVISPV